jgi:hypothetical protein
MPYFLEHYPLIKEIYNLTHEIDDEYFNFDEEIFSYQIINFINHEIKQINTISFYDLLTLYLILYNETLWSKKKHLFAIPYLNRLLFHIIKHKRNIEKIKMIYSEKYNTYIYLKMKNIYKKIDETRRFPILYKIRTVKSKEKIYEWHIEKLVTDDTESKAYYHYRHGWRDGRMTLDSKESFAKNIGRSNETTPSEQSFKEALSHFKRMIKRGYTVSISEAKKVFSNPTPMLAMEWIGAKNKPKFPLIGQPKYDGVRGFASVETNGKVVIRTRLGNTIPHFKKMKLQLERIFKEYPGKKMFLDGELFSSRFKFQKISGMTNTTRSEPDPDEDKIIFYIFDVAFPQQPKLTYRERIKILKKLPKFKNPKVSYTMNVDLKNIADIEKYVKKFSKIYEGLIIRDPESIYQYGKRSKGLYKYKLRYPDKAIIVDISLIPETRHHKGIIINVLHPIDKIKFTINGIGEEKYQIDVYNNKKQYIGKLLHYTFTQKTKDKKPREATITIEDKKYKIENK